MTGRSRARRRARGFLLAAVLLGAASNARGQGTVSTQLWGNFILDYPHGKESLFELDIEPKVQVSGEGTWRNLDLNPLVEYYPVHWLDLEGELLAGPTHQSSGADSWEVTPRVGFRVNLFSNLRERAEQSGKALGALFGRIRLAALFRIEYRNLFYDDGSPSSHQWRFRARLESKIGITHEDVSRDGTLYATADAEYFVPFGADVSETFASKVRGRVGLGYRFSYAWRAEVLYIRDANRKTRDDPFATSTNALDARVKAFF
jgi:hypothetical protein